MYKHENVKINVYVNNVAQNLVEKQVAKGANGRQ